MVDEDITAVTDGEIVPEGVVVVLIMRFSRVVRCLRKLGPTSVLGVMSV